MDLLSGQPFWFYKNGILNTYPTVTENLNDEIVIMGGGITGALMAWHLIHAGFRVTIIEKRHIGLGSTSGSTALLQYEIDTMLSELIPMIGERQAVRSYKLCIEAIDKVEAITRQVKGNTNFSRKESVYYASVRNDLEPLKLEYETRKKYGIPVDWWDQKTLRTYFPGIQKSGAIFSHIGAQIDAFRLSHALFQLCIKKGASVYDTVEVTNISQHKQGVTLQLENGFVITAKKLVVACGYESQNYLSQRIVRLHSSYAIVSKPIDKQILWHKNAMIWESARPYLYMRTTDDHRVLIGGKDEMFQSARKRDKLLNTKSKQLESAARRFFPDLPFNIDYEWCGTFAETKDGLPYIGTVAEHPNTYFALGFGGNGILFSVIAAEIITDLLQGKKNEDANIFRFDR